MLPPYRKDSKRFYIALGCGDENLKESVLRPKEDGRIFGNGASGVIAAGAFFQESIGASGAFTLEPGKALYAQIWALGEDMKATNPPDFILEGSLVPGSYPLDNDGI